MRMRNIIVCLCYVCWDERKISMICSWIMFRHKYCRISMLFTLVLRQIITVITLKEWRIKRTYGKKRKWRKQKTRKRWNKWEKKWRIMFFSIHFLSPLLSIGFHSISVSMCAFLPHGNQKLKWNRNSTS